MSVHSSQILFKFFPDQRKLSKKIFFNALHLYLLFIIINVILSDYFSGYLKSRMTIVFLFLVKSSC